MEVFLLLIAIVFLILIYTKQSSNFSKLKKNIDQLNERLDVFSEKTMTSATTPTKQEVGKSEEPLIPKEVQVPTPVETPLEKHSEKIEEKPVVSFSDGASKTPKPIQEKKETKILLEKSKKKTPKKSLFKSFKERNPDLEKFIGENLINKIGILILVLGISFFVKYAIDKDWITESARVGIGVLCGALVMAIAHKLKKNYAAFSSVLVAGGISILYFTIYIAFHEYQLFSQTIAFSIMVLITVFSTLVSVSYSRQELAVLALIGGFAVPFMVSTGEGNYRVLFSYIAILNIGILGVSYFRKWKIATILAFVFTSLLYGVWLLTRIDQSEFSHSGALVFATLFYFIFSIIIVLNNLQNKGEFSTIEYLILVANTFFFFGMGMAILQSWDSNYTGLFTLLLAVYNLCYAAILYRKFGLERNAIYLLIGLALTFVTLTIPIQFEGNQITLFWAAEAVLLLWLFQKSTLNAFKTGSIVVQILAIFSLLLDWKRYSSNSEELSIVLNPVFIAGFVVLISLFLSHWFLQKESNTQVTDSKPKSNMHSTIVLILAIVISYFTGILEVHYQATQILANNASAMSLSVAYHFVFVSLLWYFNSFSQNTNFTKGIFALGIGSVFFYLLRFYALPTNELVENSIKELNSQYAFIVHYLILGCLVYFGYQFVRNTTSVFKMQPKRLKLLPWFFVFAVVFILSNEITVHSLYFSNSSLDVNEILEGGIYDRSYFVHQQIASAKTQIVKIGYPILWGICSFIFLIIGIRKEWKNIRIIALTLLGITIVKLFLYDIKNVSETGKIIAFILLGVLVLVISFVYQKIKKLVVDETTERKIEDEKN